MMLDSNTVGKIALFALLLGAASGATGAFLGLTRHERPEVRTWSPLPPEPACRDAVLDLSSAPWADEITECPDARQQMDRVLGTTQKYLCRCPR